MFQVRHKYYKSGCIVIKFVTFAMRNSQLSRVIVSLIVCAFPYLEISQDSSNDGKNFKIGVMCAKAAKRYKQKTKETKGKSSILKTKKTQTGRKKKTTKRRKIDRIEKTSKSKKSNKKNQKSTLKNVSSSDISNDKTITYNGKTYKITKTVVGTATYYSDHGKTSTGCPVGPGVMSVDPNTIPYYSHLLVDYGNGQYEEGYALDTGGALKRHYKNVVVDIFKHSESECERLGRRNVKVYIIV